MDWLEALSMPAMVWRVHGEDPGELELTAANSEAGRTVYDITKFIGCRIKDTWPAVLELAEEHNTAHATMRVWESGKMESISDIPFGQPESNIPPTIYDVRITKLDDDHVLFVYEAKATPSVNLDKYFTIDRKLKMLEQLPGYLMELDNEGVLINLNRVHPDLDASEEDFVRRPHWDGVESEKHRKLIEDRFRCFLKTEDQEPFEFRGVPEGKWYRMWYRRVDPWSVAAIAIDITKQKEYEQEIVERNLELARSNEDLSQFAYVASHDLQEPLRTITSYLDIIREELGDDLEEELAEYMGFVAEASGRMKELIQGLLRYSRVETRGASMEALDLNSNLAMTTKMFRSHPVEFEVDKMPTVVGDPTQVRQVFENLISNSIRYRKPGTEAHVHLRYIGLQEGMHEFAVKDDGIGIDPEYHEMIFHIFKRLHTRQEYEGTGIGLALVRRIIDRHGGKVWVNSALGEGAEFHFTLPACHEN